MGYFMVTLQKYGKSKTISNSLGFLSHPNHGCSMAGLLVYIINRELFGYGAYFDRFSLVSYFEIKNSVLLPFETLYGSDRCVWPMPIWPFVFEKTLAVFLRFCLINYCHVIWCAAVNWSCSYFFKIHADIEMKSFYFWTYAACRNTSLFFLYYDFGKVLLLLSFLWAKTITKERFMIFIYYSFMFFFVYINSCLVSIQEGRYQVSPCVTRFSIIEEKASEMAICSMIICRRVS